MDQAPEVILIPAVKPQHSVTGSGVTKRVAAYCRVSTERENQQNSYAAQISYYTDHITSNPDWELVGIYADEGISGTCTKNRTQFNKMIRAARQKKIDLILCKSISRFARNTVDCLDYVRELRSLGVAVIFEKENINTDSMNSEFTISLYASFAQAESESISKNVTWGIERSFRAGKVNYRFRQTLGYSTDSEGRPYIIEDEAEIVRMIFREYADGARINEIAEKLNEMGAKRRSGSSRWTRSHIYQILRNEKYVGDAILQKSYTVNCITHERRKNTGQKPMYLIQNCHVPIIDRKTYDLVRLELEKRSLLKKAAEKSGKKYRSKYCLSQLLVCPFCGGYYKRTIWMLKGKKAGVWRCCSRLSGGGCKKAFSYHEDVLHDAVVAAVNSIVGKADLFCAADKDSRLLMDETEQQITDVNNELAKIEQEREKLIGTVLDDAFLQFSSEIKTLNDREAELFCKLKELKSKHYDIKRKMLKEEAARKQLRELRPIKKFDDDLIYRVISRIEAVGKDKLKITFYGGYSINQNIRASKK